MLSSLPAPRCYGRRMRTGPALLLIALLASACSSDPGTGSSSPATSGGSGGTACGTVEVPAHEGVDVRASGVECATARDVVKGAAGLGRAPYKVSGFACTPSDAPDGDTRYDCVADGDKRITFRYGVA